MGYGGNVSGTEKEKMERDLWVNGSTRNLPCFLNICLYFWIRAGFPFVIVDIETSSSSFTYNKQTVNF